MLFYIVSLGPAAKSGAMAVARGTDPGNEYLLLLEGDEKIRISTVELLVSLNYRVVAPRDGKTTLDIYRRQWEAGDPFDLAFIDLEQSSDMNGMEVFQQLVRLNPKVKAVATSNYTTNVLLARCAFLGFKGILVKPFSAEDLHTVLRKALESD